MRPEIKNLPRKKLLIAFAGLLLVVLFYYVQFEGEVTPVQNAQLPTANTELNQEEGEEEKSLPEQVLDYSKKSVDVARHLIDTSKKIREFLYNI